MEGTGDLLRTCLWVVSQEEVAAIPSVLPGVEGRDTLLVLREAWVGGEEGQEEQEEEGVGREEGEGQTTQDFTRHRKNNHLSVSHMTSIFRVSM